MRSMQRMAWLAVLALGGPAFGQKADLSEPPRPKECVRVGIAMKLAGERIYFQQGERLTEKVTASAQHQFLETVLAIDAKSNLPAKVARKYEAATSKLALGAGNKTDTLRPDRAIAIAQRSPDGFLAYSLGGPLTRDELDVLGGHFDTLGLVGLLPGKEVEVGATWEIGNAAVQGLCQFDGLISHKLVGKLAAITGDSATFSVEGDAQGIENGAQVTLKITATGTFDVKNKRLVALTWKQDDSREPGPVSPGFKAAVEVTLTRVPAELPKELTEAALESVPAGFEAKDTLTAMSYREPTGRFELMHSRDWIFTSQDKHTVLRLVERGDFVAQATITALDSAKPGEHLDGKAFEELVMNSPGWQPGQILQKGEVQTEIPGRHVYRVSAGGTIDGENVVQTFFLVAGPNGDQVVVAFSMKQQQVAKLGVRDLAFVQGLTFKK